jgi:hypothetical protein
MTGNRDRIAARIAVATIALTALGCGAVAEQATERMLENAIESEGGGKVDIDRDGDGSFTVESEDGTFAFGTSGGVPALISDNLDVPDGDVLVASEQEGPEGSSAIVNIALGDVDPERAAAELEASLRSGGWTIDSTSTMSGSKSWFATRGDLTATVNIYADAGEDGAIVQIAVIRAAG